MVEKEDVEALLKTGSWRTSRSRSRDPRDSYRVRYDAPYDHAKSTISISYTLERSSRQTWPPPPTVEDEAVALAKEYPGMREWQPPADEEPKNRGTIDQIPLFEVVHEYNPERRFIYIPGAATQESNNVNQARYENNTCRKFVLVTKDKGTDEKKAVDEKVTAKGQGVSQEKSTKKPDSPPKVEVPEEKPKTELPKRKSHQDLPRLNTNLVGQEQPVHRSSSRRGREKPVADQDALKQSQTNNQPSAKKSDGDDFISPSVQQTIGRRDKAYWDYHLPSQRKSGHSPSRSEAGVEVSGKRRADRTGFKHLATPSNRRRSSSTHGMPIRNNSTAEQPQSFIQLADSAFNFDRDALLGRFALSSWGKNDIYGYMEPGVDYMTGDRDIAQNSFPQRAAQIPDPQLHPRGAREMPSSSPSRRRNRRREVQERERSSSDEEAYKGKPPRHSELPYPSTPALELEEPAHSLDAAWQPSAKGLGPIPQLGPPPSGGYQREISPPQSSRPEPMSVGRARRNNDLSESPAASGSSPRRSTHSLIIGPEKSPRDQSVDFLPSASMSVRPARLTYGRNHAITEFTPSASATSLLSLDSSTDTPPLLDWQPGNLDERILKRSGGGRLKLELDRLSDCQWKYPMVVTYPGINNQFVALNTAVIDFTICVECYWRHFHETDYQGLFVAAPSRQVGQLISCDFGSSVWYRIAYILTKEQKLPDLRLLEHIAYVAARTEPCTGTQFLPRNWYSIHHRDPAYGYVEEFNVCQRCVRILEVLLRPFKGLFQPIAEELRRSSGICEMHYAPDRKRFFTYFHILREAAEKALERSVPVNVNEVARQLRAVLLHDECMRDVKVPERAWFVLKQIPEFTVCEECYDTVVWPIIEAKRNNVVVRNFLDRRQVRAHASCQLYSDRMRKVFREVCETGDFKYLAHVLQDRMREMLEIEKRYEQLKKANQADPDVQRELAALARRFKEVE